MLTDDVRKEIAREIYRCFQDKQQIPLLNTAYPDIEVEDAYRIQEFVVDAFKADGRFETRTANNGFDAGMLVKEIKPDLVVLDVMLPDINGKEVCQRVRSDSTLASVQIICISGMVEQDKIQDLRDAGANDFLSKPFDVDKLMERSYALLEMESTPSNA